MYYILPRELHAGQETGDGNAHNGSWVDVRDFVDGRIWIDTTAIDSATTLAVRIDFANTDKTIVASDQVSGISSITATGQQGVAIARPLPAFLRASWTISNGKKATFRVSGDMHGKRS